MSGQHLGGHGRKARRISNVRIRKIIETNISLSPGTETRYPVKQGSTSLPSSEV
jgi:hypothetical protein